MERIGLILIEGLVFLIDPGVLGGGDGGMMLNDVLDSVALLMRLVREPKERG